MKKILLTIAFVVTTQFAFAQDGAFKKDVLKLIELNGSSAQMQGAKAQILKMVPAEKQAAFLIEFESTMPTYYDKVAKVYMESYTKEDVKEMLAFYQTPLGKKITSKSAEIAEKSQAALQEWALGLQGMMMKYMQ